MTFGLSGIPAFEYYQPASLVDALMLRESNPQAMVYLGGSDIFPRLRSQALSLNALIDLKTIRDFPATGYLPDGSLRINPQTTFAELLPILQRHSGYAVLRDAIRQLGTPSLRNRATLAGNICNASPSADTLAPLLVLQARVVVSSRQAQRCIPIDKFLLGPRQTACDRHELLTEILLPPPLEAAGIYLKVSRNKAADLAICGAAVMAMPAAGTPEHLQFRIAVSGANPVPIYLQQISDELSQSTVTPDLLDKAARAAAQAVQPINDIRASRRYRRAMVYELVLQGLQACSAKAEGMRL